MDLGAFSISLAVNDIGASKEFYEKLGFEIFGGDASQNWLIMKNGDHVIGLFQGMLEKTPSRSILAGIVTPRNSIPSRMCASCNVVSRRRAWS